VTYRAELYYRELSNIIYLLLLLIIQILFPHAPSRLNSHCKFHRAWELLATFRGGPGVHCETINKTAFRTKNTFPI
jgi:hypothetical protein